MADAHYELPELAELYDVDGGWSEDREFYLRLAGTEPIDVLELGCGTGLIARAMARAGHRVTGIDPAQAMLDVGRRASDGDRVTWVPASAQDFQLDKRFDLIFMTGHAFQVLLDDEDITAALANIRRHLAPDGTFAFETRNPALPWEILFDKVDVLLTAAGPVPVEWTVLWRRGEFVRFDTRYRLAGGDRISESTLRFLPHDRVENLLADAGFEIRSVFGDWDRTAFAPETSREIIVVAGNPG
ncbi:MAG: class I SAM-dependent methyltransferase [Rhizobium sp.]|nr:class I SAM-dependent methyltransferase [Rhizobium sp.]